MRIAGLQETTLIDFPGKIACTVFLSGCNFRCPWCYSPELVLPEKIKNQGSLPEKKFFNFLKERVGLLEGVVICGGEPTINEDLPKFIKKIKLLGYFVKLDTNGSNPIMLEKLIDGKLIDYVAMDIKRSPGSNFQFSVFNFQKEINKSVEILKAHSTSSGQTCGFGFEFRTTVVPTVHDKKDFVEIAKWIGGKDVKYYLQNFRPEKTLDPKFKKIRPYPDEWLADVKKTIEFFFKDCQIRP